MWSKHGQIRTGCGRSRLKTARCMKSGCLRNNENGNWKTGCERWWKMMFLLELVIYIYIDNLYIMYMLYMFGFDIGFQEYRCDYSSRTQNLCLVSDLRCLVLSTLPIVHQGRHSSGLDIEEIHPRWRSVVRIWLARLLTGWSAPKSEH